MQTYKDKTTSLEKLKDIQYPLLSLTFHGIPALVCCRVLTSAQIQACGEFSLIETDKSRMEKNKKISTKDFIEHSRTMHLVAEASLIKPTYKEILNMVQANDLCQNVRKELLELREKCKSLPFSDPKRITLENEIDKKLIWTDLILPEDFLSTIFCYVVELDRSDIKKVTDNVLLNAAILAEKWHKAPHEYITGLFTEFNIMDIDRRAAIILEEKKDSMKKAG